MTELTQTSGYRDFLREIKTQIRQRQLQALSAVKPLRDHMYINNQQSQILAGIRDSLLPKLLSGEISVTQTEQVMEDAACA